MSEHGISSEVIRQAAKKVLIENPNWNRLGEKDAPADINGRNLDLEILCNLPGRDGALWKQVRHFVATNCPGLFDRTPSPDNTLRRFREVREEMEQKGQVRPALT